MCFTARIATELGAMRLLQVKADMNMMMASEMRDKRGHLPVIRAPVGVQLVLADLATGGLQVYMGRDGGPLDPPPGYPFQTSRHPIEWPMVQRPGGSPPLKFGHDSELPVTSTDLCKR